jgi:hypothetical protein
MKAHCINRDFPDRVESTQDNRRGLAIRPSWHALSTDDRIASPDLQRFVARRMGTKTIEVKASQLPLTSQPAARAIRKHQFAQTEAIGACVNSSASTLFHPLSLGAHRDESSNSLSL